MQLQAFLTFGIKCSKCNKQGHCRANCPMLARQTTGPRQASPFSPTDARSLAAPQQPSQLAPASAAPAPPTTPAEVPIEAPVVPRSTAPQPAEPEPPNQPEKEQNPAIVAAPPPPLPAPRTLETAPTTIEMMDVENREQENTGSSTSSQKSVVRHELDTFLEKASSSLYAETDQLGLQREEVLRALTSKSELRNLMPKLTAAQKATLIRLISVLLAKRPGSSTSIYKLLRMAQNSLGATPSGHRVCPETNSFHLDQGRDLCLGYNAVVTSPVAISGSGLACVFGPGVTALRQRVL
ncbi:hypothetical protein LAZ67_11001794 [Cordylochernes scorpioides]|uniref:CCHC-type domain-containing protein n=1 Tax=Cordylochernes scorpioides TaxID=51811 RepID=A0ABY6KZE6_9ARAC|nr:hypothetical protein LAZ67_11001794 [Cordylochernes scorpioides]